jgi:hypothetical protein
MITMKIESTHLHEDKFYRVKFANVAHEVYHWAGSAKAAAWDALDELLDDGHPEPLGAAAIRPAVYKEWNNHTWQYTNGNGFIRRDQTPCDNCKTPISTETHREELGLCQPCQNDYLNHTCDKCGAEEVHNIVGPFTRLCDQCQQ